MAQQQESLQDPLIGANKISDEEYLPRIARVDIFAMVFNFITWSFIILIIVYEKKGDDYKVTLFSVLGGISYILYFIYELCSTTFSYLKTKENKTIKEKMGDVYKTKPSIKLVGLCYHYEQRDIGPNGSRTVTVISHKEEIAFDYSFCRDISGNFNLNINKNNYKYKYYVILKVIHEIIFDNDLIFKEYHDIKNGIIDRNQNKDSHFKYIDDIEI